MRPFVRLLPCLLLAASLHAQGLAPAPVFSGTAKLSAQSTSGYDIARIGVDDYLRLRAAPTLAAWGVPFTANIFLSTENDPGRASISSITFDTRAFAKTLSERAAAADAGHAPTVTRLVGAGLVAAGLQPALIQFIHPAPLPVIALEATCETPTR